MTRTLTAATLLLAFTAAASAADAPPPVNYAPIAAQQGAWDAEVTFFDPASGAPTGHGQGSQVNQLLPNGHWVVNELRIQGDDKKAPPFAGHGVWGWDPVAREYIDTWVDTNDGAVRTDHGFWNAEQRTMYWTALQPDGDGHSINYRMTEAYDRDGRHRTLTFYQVAMQSGRLVKLAEMRFTKRG
jgi:hypothetical protein